MAITVLKKTPIHCVVKVTGTGAQTVTLASLATTNQTASSPKVNITGLTWSVPAGNATIARNAQNLWIVTGAYQPQMNGWSDIEQNLSDIVVTLPAGGGTVVLELMKVDGYSDSQHRDQLGAG